MATKKPRKDRKDITVKSIEKKHGLPPGTIRNPDGRDTRGDKTLKTIRQQTAARASNGNKTTSSLDVDLGRSIDKANDHMERAWGKIYEQSGKAGASKK